MNYLPSVSGILLLAITLAGCGGGGGDTTSSASTGTTGAGGVGGSSSTTTGDTTSSAGGASISTSASTGTGMTASDVTGTVMDTYITGTGDSAAFIYPTTLTALVPSGSSFTSITGTVNPDGTFVIPNVPEGVFYLGTAKNAPASTFLVTDERSFDLGTFYAGRASAKPLSISPTDLVLNLTGMAPWDDTDSLEIYSQGAAAGGDLLLNAMTTPNAGDTALTALTTDATMLFSPSEIDAAQKDTTYFTQLVGHSSGAFLYGSIGKSFLPAGFSVLDGTTTPVTGAFVTAPQATATLDWKRSQFAALAASVNPTAALASSDVYVFGEPGGPTRSTTSYVPTILYGSDAGVDDVSVKLDYGNPFPADWAASAFVYADFSVPYLVPGTATTLHAHTTIDVSGTIADVSAGAVKPLISPPVGLKIGGKDGYAVNTGVGLTPTVSWSAPTLGTSVVYQVAVRKIDGALGSGKFVARFFVKTGTSITVPPALLAAGSSYFVRVTAQTTGSATSPFKQPASGGTATTISGVFTP